MLSPTWGVPSAACTVVMVPHSWTTSSPVGTAPNAPSTQPIPANNPTADCTARMNDSGHTLKCMTLNRLRGSRNSSADADSGVR